MSVAYAGTCFGDMFGDFVRGFGASTVAQSYDWREHARPAQLPPDGDWTTWAIISGRGFGKTRSGAEFIREEVMSGRMKRVALIGPTAADVRDTMIQGESGLQTVCERYDFRPTYEPSKRKVTWPNGAIALCFSAEEPERLRGIQSDGAWLDELGAWKYPDETWSNLQFGLRLGQQPRQIVTSTPRPTKLLRALFKREGKGVVITRGSSYENIDNLAPAYREIIASFEGTRLGRQEIMGELLTDTPGALWTYELIERSRVAAAPETFARIVVAIDPAVTSGEESNETGIIVAARGFDGHGYILADRTGRYSPHEWATVALNTFDEYDADAIVIETNQGGDMAIQTIRSIRKNATVKGVHASRNKITRAEPISSLYEQNKVHHVGIFPQLEDQLTTFTPGATSPDRLDACFVAGTIVVTSLGYRRIEHVGIGDVVKTRDGWRAVVNAGMTSPMAPVRTVVFSDGRTLTGTGNHPVWTIAKGFTPLESLVWGDTMETWKESDDEKTFGSMESATRGFPTRLERIKRTITGHPARAGKMHSIARFGSRFTARFRLDFTSIIRTRTSSTTIPTTLSALPQKPTDKCTRSNTEKPGENGRQRFARSPLSGTDRLKALLGTASTAKALGPTGSLTSSSASGAGKRLSGSSLAGRMSPIAAASVIGLKLIPTIAMKSMSLARFAARSSSKTNTESSPPPAPLSVVRNFASGAAPVYNLTVQGAPEYFANGVLVHNCVWALTDLMVTGKPNAVNFDLSGMERVNPLAGIG